MLGECALRAETSRNMFVSFSLGLPSVLGLLRSEILSIVAAVYLYFSSALWVKSLRVMIQETSL